ncbi:MAG TPA: epoxide hydrolase [Acidimicrobiales bacterium]|jgi:pimeloyl-ACP methyl ester carboxylesterase|nr:epoxide hydrolase [Acidimicrobiales bacterium]
MRLAEAGLEPFRIEVPDEVLEDLRQRLARTRLPDQVPGTAWEYGFDLGYLKELIAYWSDGYDWRRHESLLNSFDQYLAEVEGQRIHLLRAPSPEGGALPLLLLHGWPGSVFEFHKVLGPLSDPRAHGASPEDAFEVVCPSLPGYGFSGPTTEPGWDSRRMAQAFCELMGRLGHERFCVQGGDWGALIATQMALAAPERLIGVHLNMAVAGPPEGDDLSGLSPAELAALDDMAHYDRVESGYYKIQSTRPQTLAYALNDSPAGLAAWIVEKFRSWSDCGGDVEASFTKDELLTNVMLYWVTGTAGSSARLYYETTKAGRFGPAGRVEVPTGCAIFPKEIIRPPRRWVEAAFNLVGWRELDRGGHFAALEVPELFVDVVREFFRGLR